jgi:hypothetical protein
MGVLDLAIDAIARNPERAEDLLNSAKSGELRSNDGAQAPYGEFALGGDSAKSHRGGVIMNNSANMLEVLAGENAAAEDGSVIIRPEVFYAGMPNGKPQVSFSDDLKVDLRQSSVRVPEGFSEARKFYSFLINQRVWRVESSKNAYTLLGGAQREFISGLHPINLAKFTREDLGNDMGLSAGSISRLTQGRYVSIKPVQGEEVVHPVGNLFSTRNDLIRYNAVRGLNAIFEGERKTGVALSDADIATKMDCVARRTVAKYRSENNIPAAHDRSESYAASPKRVFSVPYFKK